MGNLANSMNRLVDDIIVTRDNRMAFISDMKNDTDEMLHRFRNDHCKKSNDLNNSLSRFHKNLSDSTDKFLKDFRKTHEQMTKVQKDFLCKTRSIISADVSKMLETFHSERQRMGKGLRNNLRSVSIELNKAAGELSKTVGVMRKEMRDDIDRASQEWRNLSSAMATKRAGTKTETSTKVEVEAPEPVVEKPKPKAMKQKFSEKFKSRKY